MGRSGMNNQVVMDNFFELYKSELHRLGLLHKPDHIFNVDESGIDLNARAKRLLWIKNSNMFIENRKHQGITLKL